MPIHDWARVRVNRFHDFHQSWTVAICNALNASQLPPGYFAMIEQKSSDPDGDVVNFDLYPPADSEAAGYARRANRITLRHPQGSVIAAIEIVSPGNKDSAHATRSFVRKAIEFLRTGLHLLIVDLFPPGPHASPGIYKIIWNRLHDESFQFPPEKPLAAASYAVGTEIEAYVEPLAVVDPLPDMPIFLTGDRYVPCPLESTYQTAWNQFPAPLKGPLES